MMASDKTCITLSNGVTVPQLGMGTTSKGGYSNEAMVFALKECNFRHIDTARLYLTEGPIAKSVKESGVAREQLFISTKVWPTQYGYDEVKKTVKDSLRDLCVDYIDLYLLHWPICPSGTKNPKELVAESWKALEDCYQQGLCKAIGVSNFQEQDFENLKETWTVMPMMNQIEVHVCNYPKKLIDYCEGLGIRITAYCPLGKGAVLTQPEVLQIAEQQKRSPALICLRWLIQKGIVAIPKSVILDELRENPKVFDFQLSEDDMAKLDEIHKNDFQRICNVTVKEIDEWAKEKDLVLL